jgi:hypothetical protein
MPPVLAHTLSLQVTVAILKPTYSKKKKPNNREPDIVEAYEIETLLA